MPNRNVLIQPVTSAELHAVLDLPDDQWRMALVQLAERQSAAEAQETVRIASRMLTLAETLCEYDEAAASHLLKGLLRFAAQSTALSVESTAMRISGIADMPNSSLLLTEDGEALIRLLTGPAQGVHVAHGAAAQADGAAHGGDDPAPVPFAQMVFGDRTFEIADGQDEETLTFRIKGQDFWRPLETNRYAGWDVIGAEMLTLTSDTVNDYIQMHTMRMGVPELGANVHSFALDNLKWWIEIDGSVARFRASETSEWLLVPADIQERNVRELGIQAARRMIPDFRQKIDHELKSWLRRMAHAAGITPVMQAAA